MQSYTSLPNTFIITAAHDSPKADQPAVETEKQTNLAFSKRTESKSAFNELTSRDGDIKQMPVFTVEAMFNDSSDKKNTNSK